MDNKERQDNSVLHSTSEKPCRACMDFKSWMKLNTKSLSTENGKEKKSVKEGSNFIKNFNIPTEDEYTGRRQRKYTEDSRPSTSHKDPDDSYTPKWGLGSKYGCPADSESLGRGTWRFLHTLAAYYPDAASDHVKQDMRTFIKLFSEFYPCKPCADDFREWLKENPPDVSGRSSLSKWFCDAHNEVNRKLDRPEFDCRLIDERWREGWKDGSCD